MSQSKTVVSPSGAEWHVRRRWIPRHLSLLARWRKRRAKRKKDGDDGSFFDSLPDFAAVADDPISMVLSAIALTIVTVVVIFFGALFLVPLLLGAVDVIVIGVVVLVGAIGRSALGRPWVIEASHDESQRVLISVKGYRRSGRVLEAVATALQAGNDVGRAARSAGALELRHEGSELQSVERGSQP